VLLNSYESGTNRKYKDNDIQMTLTKSKSLSVCYIQHSATDQLVTRALKYYTSGYRSTRHTHEKLD